MIGLAQVYGIAGLVFFAIAIAIGADRAEPRRFRASLFYGLLGVSFAFGDQIGDLGNGVLAFALIGLVLGGALGAFKGPDPRPEPQPPISRIRLFLPALAIPLFAFSAALWLPGVHLGRAPLLAAGVKSLPSLVGLTLGAVVALCLCPLCFPMRASEPVAGGRGLLQALGWMALLPQMLAALGVVFAFAGVGGAISEIALSLLPAGNRLAAVVVYCLGMAAFTAVMGNAFAAFPVLTSGLGLPLLIGRFHGDPAAIGAIGMLSGFCGTLVTPMAANFNLAPAALLALKDRNGVIRAQTPTAVLVLIGNIALMNLLAFPNP